MVSDNGQTIASLESDKNHIEFNQFKLQSQQTSYRLAVWIQFTFEIDCEFFELNFSSTLLLVSLLKRIVFKILNRGISTAICLIS